mmetsp:Transcript_8793/g.25592  ORF Transcript_8793/g.25592 Transcript_8793/m.25592 type:complete len:274 (-) Transcript_8793:196-1017(-)
MAQRVDLLDELTLLPLRVDQERRRVARLVQWRVELEDFVLLIVINHHAISRLQFVAKVGAELPADLSLAIPQVPRVVHHAALDPLGYSVHRSRVLGVHDEDQLRLRWVGELGFDAVPRRSTQLVQRQGRDNADKQAAYYDGSHHRHRKWLLLLRWRERCAPTDASRERAGLREEDTVVHEAACQPARHHEGEALTPGGGAVAACGAHHPLSNDRHVEPRQVGHRDSNHLHVVVVVPADLLVAPETALFPVGRVPEHLFQRVGTSGRGPPQRHQ